MLEYTTKARLTNNCFFITEWLINYGPCTRKWTIVFPLMRPRPVIKFSELRNNVVEVPKSKGDESIQAFVSQ
jgi:hypothetical protein